MPDALIFRTSRLLEADQFAEALKSKKIPFYRRTDAGGIEFAMPAAPADFPGQFWSVYAPPASARDARRVLKTMPFDVRRDANWEPSERDIWNWYRFLLAVVVGAVIVLSLRFCS